ncbi:MAG: methylmalonyl-CoA epimerase [Candidatus Eisenbacteria bacterium]|nr:methylmalonyl-CoA epimerase [Candidatus Eisenbacteria bacterium]
MARRIDHIGIAVGDVAAALAFYRDALGLELTAEEPVPSQKLVSYHLRIGEANLELLSPTAPDSVIARFLEKRGPGIHHIALAVDDVEAEMARLRDAGYRLLGEKPTPGAGGKQVIFLHPKSTGGVLLELCADTRHAPRPSATEH